MYLIYRTPIDITALREEVWIWDYQMRVYTQDHGTSFSAPFVSAAISKIVLDPLRSYDMAAHQVHFDNFVSWQELIM
jgi:hypothetical protein